MKPSIRQYQQGSTIPQESRAEQVRRDNDTVKIPTVTLHDIDYAVFFHLTENYSPTVPSNGAEIPVPLHFAAGEKWAQIRQFGYMRDNNRKIMTPVMTLRRLDVASDDRVDLPSPMTNQFSNYGSYRVIPYKTMNMQYDRTAGQYRTKTSHEYYMVAFPTYVRVNYELIIWTDLQTQMNKLVQGIIAMDGHLWGDYYQFRTVLGGITHDNVNVPGEDRLIKTTVSLTVDGYLREEFEYHQSNIQKQFSIKRVEFMNESVDEILFEDYIPNQNNVHEIADNLNLKDLRRKIR